MNKIQPLDQVSSIIANALNQSTNVRKSYQKFFIETIILILTSKLSAIALDHSYLPKSGKKTPGLGYYWSGCAGRTKRGLEILGFAHIQSDINDARFLFSQQTLSKKYRDSYTVLLQSVLGSTSAACSLANACT